jgi:dUTPase
MTQIFNNNLLNDLVNIYERVMLLNIYVDGDTELQNKYYEAAHNHNNKLMNNPYIIDAGFDLFAPGNEGNELDQFGDDLRFFGPNWQNRSPVNKLDYKICCSAKMVTDKNKIFNTGFYMYPRSSISKTQLRLANSTGIIDAGYRGHLMGMFDVINIDPNINIHSINHVADFLGKKFDRYVQLCAPGLVPILVKIVSSMEELGEETERGSGGFGSTGR